MLEVESKRVYPITISWIDPKKRIIENKRE